jgi:hypothetical protein
MCLPAAVCEVDGAFESSLTSKERRIHLQLLQVYSLTPAALIVFEKFSK